MMTGRFGTHLPHLFMCQRRPHRQPTSTMGAAATLGLVIGMAYEAPPAAIRVPAAIAIGRIYLLSMMGFSISHPRWHLEPRHLNDR
jgi:hypothetical protein